MSIIAIDPGNEESAFVVYDHANQNIERFGTESNEELLKTITHGYFAGCERVVIEQLACMGMAVGETILETGMWTGRFIQAWVTVYPDKPFHRIKRIPIKLHLCGSARAKDGNVRQALIDRLGPPGTKKNPGKTYKISGDVWAALAVAVTFAETSEWAKARNGGLVS